MQRIAMGLAFAVMAFGAAAEEPERGREEYLESCAACHGVDGRGGGPQAPRLTKRPTDLTNLAAQNGGEFPYWNVFVVIDGRYIVPGHGDRDMPVWGREFLAEETRIHGPKGGEKAATQRMLELTNYVRSLQR